MSETSTASTTRRRIAGAAIGVLILVLATVPVLAQNGEEPTGFDRVFKTSRLNIFLLVALFGALVLWSIRLAAAGRRFFIRKIAGLEAIEEGSGR